VNWWSKLWLAFIPVFLVFGCLSLVKGELHEAASTFSVLGLFVAMYGLEGMEVGRVGRSAPRWTYRAFAILGVALSVFVGFVTGLWVLAALVFLILAMVERLVEKRSEGSAAG
jgi:L-lactate permease